MNNIKGTLTTVGAVVVLIIGIVQTGIQASGTGPIDWMHLGVLAVVALIGYFTGTNPDGTGKTPGQITTANNGL